MASSVAVPAARRGLPAALRRGIQFLMLLALWQVYVVWSDVEPLIFPAPSDVGRALWTGWVSGDLARATGATIWLLLLRLRPRASARKFTSETVSDIEIGVLTRFLQC